MRENIGLFRGKRIDNGEWVKGYLVCSKVSEPRKKEKTIRYEIFVPFTEQEEKENEGHIFSAVGGIWHKVDPDTIGECTELRDLRRDVLFEHDIVTAKFKSNGARCNFKIIFEAGSFLFDNGKVAVPFKEIRSAVKIGNVTDNPELLKGGEGE